jgi:hypothetical protein
MENNNLLPLPIHRRSFKTQNLRNLAVILYVKPDPHWVIARLKTHKN